MNFRLLSKILGLLLLLLTAAMSICLAYAALSGERKKGFDAMEGFAVSMALTCLSAVGLLVLGRGSGREILRREAIAIVGLGWMLSAAFGGLPYIFCRPQLSVAGAYFEAMSGFTTTGASVISDLTEFPRSVLLWRALTQWMGGVGILVLFVALLSYFGVGSKSLFRHESSAKSGEGLQARIRDVAAQLWLIYLGLSAVCCLGLWAFGMTLFEALTHTFAAVSTGGFGTLNNSIAGFNSVWIELWLVLFMILGGTSFMLLAWLLRGRWERWHKEEETRAYLLILLIASCAIAIDLMFRQRPFGEAFRAAIFQATSIMTTTGFVTDDYDKWPALSQVLLLILMVIGGCAGSTSGGLKVSRIVLFFKIIRIELIASFRPNQIIPLHLNGNPADETLKAQTGFFLALACITIALGTGIVSILEPRLDVLSSVSAVITTLCNVGPGLHAVGPTHNFGDLHPSTLVFLSFLMVIGRLEFYAVLVLLMPSLWKKY